MNHRYLIGKLLRSLGYELQPLWKSPLGELNLVELAAGAMASAGKLETVLQIGAYDGDLHDPLQDRVIHLAKRTVLVEPQPSVAARLRKKYEGLIASGKVIVVEAAIADSDGEATLYSDSDETPRASLNKSHLDRFGADCRVTTKVETLTPASLLKRCGLSGVELLQIDTEGMDWTILKIFFDEGVRPPVVNYEHLHLPQSQREEARARLSAEGYEWREYGWDTIAMLPELVYPQVS